MKAMRRILMVGVFALAVIAVVYQARQASRLRADVDALRDQQARATERIRKLQHERDEATNVVAVVSAEAARLKAGQNPAELLKLRGEVGVLRQQLAVLKAEAASTPGTFPALLKNPAMRDFMRQSNANMIKWNFGSLFKELKLTPGQTDKAVQLIVEQAEKEMDKMYALPQGSLSAKEITQVTTDYWAGLNDALRPVWGDSGSARFKQFVEEIPAHATVDMLNGQLGANQLSGEQGDKLYQIVKKEPFEITRGFADLSDLAFWGSQEHIDEHLLQVAESNQHIVEQASSILAPEQLNVLSTVLSNGIDSRIKQAAARISKH
jgi:hypothetical protein